jgi:hypothetical protein
MNAGPFVYHVSQISMDEQTFLRLYIRSCLHSVQVDSACELAPVKPDLVIPCLLLSCIESPKWESRVYVYLTFLLSPRHSGSH